MLYEIQLYHFLFAKETYINNNKPTILYHSIPKVYFFLVEILTPAVSKSRMSMTVFKLFRDATTFFLARSMKSSTRSFPPPENIDKKIETKTKSWNEPQAQPKTHPKNPLHSNFTTHPDSLRPNSRQRPYPTPRRHFRQRPRRPR